MKPYYHDEAAGITIYCGDTLEILPQLDVVGIKLVLADPPYGIGLEVHSHNRNKWGKDWSLDGDSDQQLGNAVCAWVFAQQFPLVAFASPQKPWIGDWGQYLVWDKGPAVGGGGNKATHWKKTWELIQVANTGQLNGKRDSAVLEYWVSPNFRRDFEFHMCQKPVPLLRYLIEKTTQAGDTVLDPFMGSGSILRAAKDARRRAVGIELLESCCEIAARRLDQGVFNFEETPTP